MTEHINKKQYHYNECGLDNVMIVINASKDDSGEETITIPNIGKLHKAITMSILTANGTISGKELRFLRTEMGFTQDDFAKHIGLDSQTIGRWERGENDIKLSTEVFIRTFTAEKLKVQLGLNIENISKLCQAIKRKEPFLIDGTDPENYKLVA